MERGGKINLQYTVRPQPFFGQLLSLSMIIIIIIINIDYQYYYRLLLSIIIFIIKGLTYHLH